MKTMRCLVAALAVATAGSAAAEANPLSVEATIAGWSLTFETSVLQKGWFTQGNQFDRTKTTLVAEITALQSACSNAPQSDARLSTADGSIVIGEVLNANGNSVTGYYWEYTGWDLTNLRNSYSLRHLCDGTTEVRGCDSARPIELTLHAVDKSGVVRTFLDDAGVAQPVTFTVSGLELAAYHDTANDQWDTCEQSCGIGACQSACVDACPQGQDGKDCREACECTCKIRVYEETGGVCHAKDKCLQTDPTAAE
jgi:opacity protein-like surface antigen